MSSDLSIPLSPDLLTTIAERAAEIAAERLVAPSPWMTREQAARYLSVPRSRLEKDRDIPCRRWEGRILYRRDELDAWLDQFRDEGRTK